MLSIPEYELSIYQGPATTLLHSLYQDPYAHVEVLDGGQQLPAWVVVANEMYRLRKMQLALAQFGMWP